MLNRAAKHFELLKTNFIWTENFMQNQYRSRKPVFVLKTIFALEVGAGESRWGGWGGGVGGVQ